MTKMEGLVYKEDLDNERCPCGIPGCEQPLYAQALCHPDAPLWVRYFDGILTLTCSVCGRDIDWIVVASRENSSPS